MGKGVVEGVPKIFLEACAKGSKKNNTHEEKGKIEIYVRRGLNSS